MTEKRKTLSKTKRLRVRKETLKDLQTKNAGRVKGGAGFNPSQLCDAHSVICGAGRN
jgi:hypothetical protein